MYIWSPHVKCLDVLYDSSGPPYLIWNRYHMVPPHILYESYDPDTLHGVGI